MPQLRRFDTLGVFPLFFQSKMHIAIDLSHIIWGKYINTIG